jgi:hypothetical protein
LDPVSRFSEFGVMHLGKYFFEVVHLVTSKRFKRCILHFHLSSNNSDVNCILQLPFITAKLIQSFVDPHFPLRVTIQRRPISGRSALGKNVVQHLFEVVLVSGRGRSFSSFDRSSSRYTLIALEWRLSVIYNCFVLVSFYLVYCIGLSMAARRPWDRRFRYCT